MLDVRLDGAGVNALATGAGVLSTIVAAIVLVGVWKATLVLLPPAATARLVAEGRLMMRFFLSLLFLIWTRQQIIDSTAIIMRKIQRTVCLTHMEGS